MNWLLLIVKKNRFTQSRTSTGQTGSLSSQIEENIVQHVLIIEHSTERFITVARRSFSVHIITVVVALALARIGEHTVRFTDILKLLLLIGLLLLVGVRVSIRMKFHGFLSVRLFDIGIVGCCIAKNVKFKV